MTLFYPRLHSKEHGLRTPSEEITLTSQLKIHSHSQILGTAEAYFVCHISPIGPFKIVFKFKDQKIAEDTSVR